MWSVDPLRHRLLLRRPVHRHGKLAELRRRRTSDRARVLALYRIIDIGSVTGAQFLIPVFGADGFTIFAIMSIMITLSLVPVSLGDRSNPTPPEDVKLDLRRVWRISPLACIGCIAVGVTNSAFRTLSPVYAEQIGMSVTDVVTFVSVGIIGGAIIQYPLGHLSDRWDRRKVLLITTGGAMLAALALVFLAGTSAAREFRAGFRLRLVRHAAVLAVGRARQRPRRQGRVRAGQCRADAVLFVRRDRRPARRGLLHAALRPAIAVHLHAPSVYAVFILIILYRMQARAGVPAEPARPLHRAAAAPRRSSPASPAATAHPAKVGEDD